jgi:hypothetical protein
VDAVLCSVQTGTQESQASRSRSLRVRLGVVAIMASVIEYYVPRKLQKQSGKWIPPEQRGGIIPFPVLEKKSVLRRFRLAWPQLSSGFHALPRSMGLLCSFLWRQPLCIHTIPNSQGHTNVSLLLSR